MLHDRKDKKIENNPGMRNLQQRHPFFPIYLEGASDFSLLELFEDMQLSLSNCKQRNLGHSDVKYIFLVQSLNHYLSSISPKTLTSTICHKPVSCQQIYTNSVQRHREGKTEPMMSSCFQFGFCSLKTSMWTLYEHDKLAPK